MAQSIPFEKGSFDGLTKEEKNQILDGVNLRELNDSQGGVGLLAKHLVEKFCKKYQIKFDKLETQMSEYYSTGNYRIPERYKYNLLDMLFLHYVEYIGKLIDKKRKNV